MLRDAIALTIDWFREPLGQLTYLQPPDWPRLWQRLRNYVQVAALLAAWLGFWALYRRKVLRPSGTTQPAPAPLADAVLCQRYGIAEKQLLAWRAQRVVTLAVAEDGRISAATITPQHRIADD